MVLSERFDHQTAIASAIQLRIALRRHRRELAVSSVFASAPNCAEIERAASDLRTRESALKVFLRDPYAQSSLFDMRADDRSILMAAGTHGTASLPSSSERAD